MVEPRAMMPSVKSALGFFGDPEMDGAFHHYGAVVADTAHAHRQVRAIFPGVLGHFGDYADIGFGLGGVLHVHAFRNPAQVRRDRGFRHHAHGEFQPVADGDHVHGADMVFHRAALFDHGFAVVALEGDQARTHGAEVGRLAA